MSDAAQPRKIKNFRTKSDVEPFHEWITKLRDRQGANRILNILSNRVALGNLGDHHAVGEGVFEFRYAFGPGYRIYYGEDGDQIILLTGGDKDSQDNDVQRAKAYWRNYNAEED